MSTRPDLPNPIQSDALAGWLAGPRGRLLRRVHIGRRRRVLEIGCGHGSITEDLVRRCDGTVFCIDRDIGPTACRENTGALLLGADAMCLPFADSAFDLLFCENVLMWVNDLEAVAREAMRVLEPGGALVAIEPDYGGMIEHPAQISLRDVWINGLRRSGADPCVGRRLPGLLETLGLRVWVELLGVPQPATPEATALLSDLPLTDDERAQARQVSETIRQGCGVWDVFVHVPYFLIIAERPAG